ncbi:hypothetical protein SAMN04488059_113108 [Devosia psychrophila]|uniref:Uncharacterized protein n=1 Tax=Devosia psychrophila TaxID=728005 RepID=A0A1I1MT81_9HYPH|nr:hypothetical protein SAMN04488059_113108 [Devosia psychrophila]
MGAHRRPLSKTPTQPPPARGGARHPAYLPNKPQTRSDSSTSQGEARWGSITSPSAKPPPNLPLQGEEPDIQPTYQTSRKLDQIPPPLRGRRGGGPSPAPQQNPHPTSPCKGEEPDILPAHQMHPNPDGIPPPDRGRRGGGPSPPLTPTTPQTPPAPPKSRPKPPPPHPHSPTHRHC